MKSRKQFKTLAALLAILIAAILGHFQTTQPEPMLSIPENGALVSFVDVGQGDCTLAMLPDGKVMLIDCGEYDYRHEVANYLDSMGVTTIDYLISTHPHTDHMGGMAYIIDEFNVSAFYMPDVVSTTTAFEKMLLALSKKSITPQIVSEGDVIFQTESTSCTVLSPVHSEYDDINNASVVVKLRIGEKSFLFMGDAEHYAERQITQNVDADVLKIGHHGSSGSTSQEFFGRVSPQMAVISCGKDNPYGHPHREIIELLESNKISYYRTDTDGTVTMVCDGKNIEVSMQNQ